MAGSTPKNTYEQYLMKLIEDAQRVDADFRNYMTLWEHMDEYLDAINEAPGTFRSIINGLRTSTVVLIHRLFDSGSVNLKKIIGLAKTHLDTIDWSEKPTMDALDKHLEKIDEFASTLDRLRVQRNKAYAHLDKKPIQDAEAFADKTPLDSKDLRKAIDLAFDILQDHYRFFSGPHLEMQVKNSVQVKHLLELIRHGVQPMKEGIMRS